jgi:Acetyltransferase (GNAT) domain
VRKSLVVASPLAQADGRIFAQWSDMFHQYGTVVLQSPVYSQALDAARNDGAVWVCASRHFLAAFFVTGTIATGIFTSAPALAEPEQGPHVFEAALRHLLCESTAELVYLPHLEEPLWRGSLGPQAISWPRPPRPIIDWTDRGAGLWRRVERRLGSQARRRQRKFERRGLLCTILNANEAVSAVDAVERNSWKARALQSMHHRAGQYALYTRLIRAGLVETAVVMDGQRPVAFRLDSRVHSRVACLKWSYDEDYQQTSPGFYLMTTALVNRWREEDIELIDLFGSPDTLKELVQTNMVPRFDLAWPRNRLAFEVKRERCSHDVRTLAALRAGIGLKRLYLGGAP